MPYMPYGGVGGANPYNHLYYPPYFPQPGAGMPPGGPGGPPSGPFPYGNAGPHAGKKGSMRARSCLFMRVLSMNLAIS